jgi:hypothetical protein
MLRALAGSVRPLTGGLRACSAAPPSWPRAFATAAAGDDKAQPSSTSAVAEQSGGGDGSTGSGSGSGREQQQRTPPPQPEADGWTEVVDDASGKSYWWNQQTGQTTDLGSARPAVRFWSRPGGGGGGGSGGASAGGAGAAAEGGGDDYDDPHFRDGQGVWREPPGRDRTWTYSVIGVGIGMAAGWLTQYIH